MAQEIVNSYSKITIISQIIMLGYKVELFTIIINHSVTQKTAQFTAITLQAIIQIRSVLTHKILLIQGLSTYRMLK